MSNSRGRVAFVIAKAPKARGLSERRPPPPYLDPEDAAFVEAKRKLGYTDAQIAKMLGCTEARIRSNVVAPEAPTAEEVAWAEREARRREAQAAALRRREERHARAEEERWRRAKLRGS